MELARRILVYRVAHNLTQNEMEKILDISHATLSAMEQNKKVSMKTQIKVELKLNELEGK